METKFDFISKIKKNSLYTILSTLNLSKINQLSKIKKKAILSFYLSRRKLYDK